ncbi:MAG: UDP-N-acetylglucosamine 1-carboxyvinyltransferase [Pseudomonadota bacterium]
MDKILIRGGNALNGRIAISGAKNAALPLMAASLLTEAPLVLTNMPRLADINTMSDLLIGHGVKVGLESQPGGMGRQVTLQAAGVSDPLAPYDVVRKMRASILVLGPLLARGGKAVVSLPGGCAIGTRPIDLHLKAMQALGADIELDSGYVHASAPRGLTGGVITFPFVTVGGTENALMAAALARGTSRIENAAMEPEITDLAHCLTRMGAKISGIGTSKLTIHGVPELHGAAHSVLPDRIETGSYIAAAAITGGQLELTGTRLDILGQVIERFEAAGVILDETGDVLHVSTRHARPLPVQIKTAPFPAFATDMQAQFMAMMSVATGTSAIAETVFENRFMHVPELARMGARIKVNGGIAIVDGRENLIGAPVMATDLRASMSLVLAGLAAQGETEINRVYHLDRGYERLEEKLQTLGADIERVSA